MNSDCGDNKPKDNDITIEKAGASNIVKEIKGYFIRDKTQKTQKILTQKNLCEVTYEKVLPEKVRVAKRRSTKKMISKKSFADMSKLLINFKKEDAILGAQQYETKLEKMVNILFKIKDKLISYQDIHLAEDLTW